MDPGAGSSFTKSLLIPRELHGLIRPLEDRISGQDQRKIILMIADTIDLVVKIESRTSANVTFNVVEWSGIDIMLRCDFFDALVETDYTWQ